MADHDQVTVRHPAIEKERKAAGNPDLGHVTMTRRRFELVAEPRGWKLAKQRRTTEEGS